MLQARELLKENKKKEGRADFLLLKYAQAALWAE